MRRSGAEYVGYVHPSGPSHRDTAATCFRVQGAYTEDAYLSARTAHEPLIERDQALAEVRAAWQRAAPGHGHCWLISAEGGGGKTAFVRACVHSLQADCVFWGDAEPLSPPEPYLAIARALPGFVPGATSAISASRALDALHRRAGGTRAVLVLDDLHFADEGTLCVAQRIAVEARAQGWLVLLSFRPREGLRALADMAADLVGSGRATRLDLAELSPAGVAELVHRVRGSAVPAAAVEIEQIHRDSGGNPWFVEALARGDARLSAAHQHLQVQLTRIERDLPGALAVLSAFSVVTRPIGFSVVAAICGGDSSHLRALLQALRDARILLETNDTWQLRQEMLRQATTAAMIPADVRDAHRRLAEALLHEGRAAELAMHFAAAVDGRAAAWALRAAREAIAMEAHAEAYAQLARALSGELSGELSAADRLLAYELAATEAGALFRVEEPVRLAQQGLALAGGDLAAAVRLATSLALTLHWRGQVEEADVYWRRAAQDAASLGHVPDVALMHGWHALCLIASEQPMLARVAAADARAALEGADAAHSKTLQLAAALADMADTLAAMNAGVPDATETAMCALRAVRQVGLVPGTMAQAAFCSTGLVALQLDAVDAEAAELAATLERRQVGLQLSNRAIQTFAALQRGNLGPVGLPDPRGTPLPPRSGVAGRILAAHTLRELRGGTLAAADVWLGAVLNPEQRPLAAASLDIARLEYLHLHTPAAVRGYAEQLFEAGMQQQSARVCGEAAVHLARAGVAVPTPVWLHGQSQLRLFWHWAQAILDKHPSGLRSVAATLSELGCPYESALALVDAGDLSAAYRKLRGLSATTLRERVASRMRQAHIPVPRRTRSAVAADGLTDTERNVCALVAVGLKNRELAERLHMSVRTVETHLSNIYRKTSTDNRAALTRLWSVRSANAEGQ